jgi:hypothetical protein
MSRKKGPACRVSGGQLLGAGDVIHIQESDKLIKCKVLSALQTEDGACMAGLEILEGDRQGERFTATLRAGAEITKKLIEG